MDGGPHSLVLEYYENGGGAVARLRITPVGDPPADTAWHGRFWNTPDVAGIPEIPTEAPDLERDDETLDFDWGEGSPGAGIAGDHFVASWTRTVTLSAGVYRFAGTRDDGMRVFLDGVEIIDRWTFGNAAFSVDKVVTGGSHELRVDHFEGGGGARAELNYDRIGDVVAGDGGYTAEYFANRSLQGPPALTREDDAIDFSWGGGAPGDGIPADNFSARWTKALTLETGGTYKFTVTSDDGVRLFVDGQVLLDRWVLQSATTHTATRALEAGTHQVVLEYFEAGGDAEARMTYEPTADPPPPPPEPFLAEYFDNSVLAGAPTLVRTDNAIDFDWGEAAPHPSLPVDRFSVRWTRSKHYDAGTYRFSVTGDDGIRVLIDGSEAVNGWFYQAPTTYSSDVELTEGEHTVVVEYFEWTVGAVARFSEVELDDPAALLAPRLVTLWSAADAPRLPGPTDSAHRPAACRRRAVARLRRARVSPRLRSCERPPHPRVRAPRQRPPRP